MKNRNKLDIFFSKENLWPLVHSIRECQGQLFGLFTKVNLLQQLLISGLLLAMTGSRQYLCTVLLNSPQEPMCSYRDYCCWAYVTGAVDVPSSEEPVIY